MGVGDSRRALARTIWARRTRKASTVRRSASNWIRSLSVKGRINIGGFIAQVYQLEAQLHKNSCGDALGIPLDLEIHSLARGGSLMPTIVDFPTIVKDAVDVFGDLFAHEPD